MRPFLVESDEELGLPWRLADLLHEAALAAADGAGDPPFVGMFHINLFPR